jgi:hypothetical protein
MEKLLFSHFRSWWLRRTARQGEAALERYAHYNKNPQKSLFCGKYFSKELVSSFP